MKKILTGIAAMTLVISVSIATTFAAVGDRGHNFVDNDSDGICDNYSSNGCGKGAGYVDTDGDGICDNYSSNGCGKGAGYVDADGDGICDNYTTGTSQNGSGFRRGHCGRQGRRGR